MAKFNSWDEVVASVNTAAETCPILLTAVVGGSAAIMYHYSDWKHGANDIDVTITDPTAFEKLKAEYGFHMFTSPDGHAVEVVSVTDDIDVHLADKLRFPVWDYIALPPTTAVETITSLLVFYATLNRIKDLRALDFFGQKTKDEAAARKTKRRHCRRIITADDANRMRDNPPPEQKKWPVVLPDRRPTLDPLGYTLAKTMVSQDGTLNVNVDTVKALWKLGHQSHITTEGGDV